MKAEKIRADIIVVCWNHLAYTQRCIRGIRENTLVPYRLIVSDGASTDGTVEWLAEQDDITAIFAEANDGIEPATNRALKISTAPYVVLIGDDVEVGRGWLGLLIEGLENNPEVGYISAMEASRVHSNPDGPVRITVRPQGTTCVLLRRETIQDVGLMDERFAFSRNGDSDYGYRIKLAGWKVAEHHGVFFRHDPRTTVKDVAAGLPGGWSEFVASGKRKLREKYPDVPSWSGYAPWKYVEHKARKRKERG